MSLLDSIASKFATLLNRVDDHIIERRLNIRTTGWHTVDVPDAVPYSTFSYSGIFQVLDHLRLQPDDVFIDIGCGKGRIVCAAALRPLRKVIGIDIDQTLCEQARSNAHRLRHRRTAIETVNQPAQQFDYRECTALMLFNPFNFGVLKAVCDAIIASTQVKPRAIRLAYVNPRCESVLRETGAFERYDHWPLRLRSRLKFEVSFWRTIDRNH
jgi:SAM-dependent methyltransferase